MRPLAAAAVLALLLLPVLSSVLPVPRLTSAAPIETLAILPFEMVSPRPVPLGRVGIAGRVLRRVQQRPWCPAGRVSCGPRNARGSNSGTGERHPRRPRGARLAEWVESGRKLKPGTIVVVDPNADDGVRPSSRAYDTSVAGAISAQPGLALGAAGESKSLVAQSGRVRITVDAQYGAVRPGDLLVTSPTPGHAMVAKAGKVKPGMILGKALQPLAKGQGEILALLTLQ